MNDPEVEKGGLEMKGMSVELYQVTLLLTLTLLVLFVVQFFGFVRP